jgi:peptidyl-prolyl cis-trans isomerase B (cyclophilin B)
MSLQRNHLTIHTTFSHPPSVLVLVISLALLCLTGSTAFAEHHEKKAGVEAIDAFIASMNIDKSASNWKERLPRPPKVKFDSSKKYYWVLNTNKGTIKVLLLSDSAPMHVSSTIYLTRLGFYDDVIFHRVIPGFMAQGGDPTGTGRGGPGYQYGGEFASGVGHDAPGMLSMANAGPNTDGSQFFLTFKPTPYLDGKHTVFGKVEEGMGSVRQLEQAGTPGRGVPKEKLFIKKATISVE